MLTFLDLCAKLLQEAKPIYKAIEFSTFFTSWPSSSSPYSTIFTTSKTSINPSKIKEKIRKFKETTWRFKLGKYSSLILLLYGFKILNCSPHPCCPKRENPLGGVKSLSHQ